MLMLIPITAESMAGDDLCFLLSLLLGEDQGNKRGAFRASWLSPLHYVKQTSCLPSCGKCECVNVSSCDFAHVWWWWWWRGARYCSSPSNRHFLFADAAVVACEMVSLQLKDS